MANDYDEMQNKHVRGRINKTKVYPHQGFKSSYKHKHDASYL